MQKNALPEIIYLEKITSWIKRTELRTSWMSSGAWNQLRHLVKYKVRTTPIFIMMQQNPILDLTHLEKNLSWTQDLIECGHKIDEVEIFQALSEAQG